MVRELLKSFSRKERLTASFVKTVPSRREVITSLSREKAEAAQDIMPATVSVGVIKLLEGNQIAEGVGSGFVIKSSPERVIIATNKHVISDALGAFVQSSDTSVDGNSRKREVYQSELLYVSPDHDIAFLGIRPSEHPEVHLPAIKFGNLEDMRLGNNVMAVGTPYELDGTISYGEISRREPVVIPTDFSEEPLIEISAPIDPGNSGGPVINPSKTPSEVIGIAVAQVKGVSRIGFMIPISSLQQDIERFESQESARQTLSTPTFAA